MQEAQKWRDVLASILQDSREKYRIARAVGVSPVTLQRWVTGETKPRLQNIRQLIHVLPEYRSTWMSLIPEEQQEEVRETVRVENPEQEIPSVFYARVLNAHCNLPRIIHFSSLCDIILQQALTQLDPTRVGMELTVVQCMYPTQDGKIRSLREHIGRGTGLWSRELDQRILFLGAESLAGSVVMHGRSHVIQNRQEGLYLFPARWVEWEESAMGYPIMRSDHIAGCLLASSTQINYFVSPGIQKLIQHYAELLSVIFEPELFYPLKNIDLGTMPNEEIQRPMIIPFRQRTAEVMTRNGMNVVQAERVVWHEIEEALLAYQFEHLE